jgi:hypothetical protein
MLAREAFFAQVEEILVKDSVGRVAGAEQVARAQEPGRALARSQASA